MYLLLSPNSIGVQVPIPLFHSAVQTDTLIKDEASVVGVIQRGSGQPAGVYTLIGEKVPFLAKECHEDTRSGQPGIATQCLSASI